MGCQIIGGGAYNQTHQSGDGEVHELKVVVVIPSAGDLPTGVPTLYYRVGSVFA